MYNTKYFKLVKVICPCISDFEKFGSDNTCSKLNLNAIDNAFWKKCYRRVHPIQQLSRNKNLARFPSVAYMVQQFA